MIPARLTVFSSAAADTYLLCLSINSISRTGRIFIMRCRTEKDEEEWLAVDGSAPAAALGRAAAARKLRHAEAEAEKARGQVAARDRQLKGLQVRR